MKSIRLIILLLLYVNISNAQKPGNNSYIKNMQWGGDYRIQLTLLNDSSYTVNVEDLIHSKLASSDTLPQKFVYYPVMLARDFVDKIKENSEESDNKTTNSSNPETEKSTGKKMTLWTALHSSVGGGWVHFINCMLYSLDTRYLSLTAPLMERPKSSWKPKPITDTYLRTKKWKYYVPVDQKQAQKEYFIKKNENQLASLHDVPSDFITLFLETNNKQYKKIIQANDHSTQSKIDLVKLLLGSNYLSMAQITYIKTMVQKAMVKYSYNQLPNIIVFDDLQAAVEMSLNETGYNLEQVVFRNTTTLTSEDKEDRLKKIESTIRSINKVNQKVFEQQLKKIYN